MEPKARASNSLAAAMTTSLRGYLQTAHPYQRFLYLVAVVFAASAVLHAVAFVVDDRPWISEASWRQPMAFSTAFVFVLAALGWVMTFLPRRQRLGWAVCGTLGVATLGTVFLIALQAWRGQPAFFPEDLPFDERVWTGIQIGIAFIVLPIVVLTVWAFTPLEAPPSFHWAIRSGLVLMVAGLAMGGVMVGEGVRQDLAADEPGNVKARWSSARPG